MTLLDEVIVEFSERPRAGAEPPVLTLTERNGFVRQADRFKKRLATDDTRNYKVVHRNDIAFNPYLLWAGAVAQNTIVEQGIISPLYPTFRAREGYDPRFVARLLLAPQMIAAYDGIAYGSVPRRRRSSVSDFLALPIATPPPLPEQRRIAAILDQADALRAKRRQVLAHLDALTQSIFHDMFGDLDCFHEFGSVIVSGPTNGLYRPASDYGDGTPILRIDGFSSGEVLTGSGGWKRLRADDDEVRRYGLCAGDLVINRVNALSHLGKSALVTAVTEPCVFESNMMRVRVDTERIFPKYVLAWLQTDDTKQQILRKAKKAINQASINQTDVKSLLLPIPTAEAQQRFVTRISALNDLRAITQRALTSDDELFASLQSRAFDGRL